eukprot:3698490-Amphidinium_carterae.1
MLLEPHKHFTDKDLFLHMQVVQPLTRVLALDCLALNLHECSILSLQHTNATSSLFGCVGKKPKKAPRWCAPHERAACHLTAERVAQAPNFGKEGALSLFRSVETRMQASLVNEISCLRPQQCLVYCLPCPPSHFLIHPQQSRVRALEFRHARKEVPFDRHGHRRHHAPQFTCSLVAQQVRYSLKRA